MFTAHPLILQQAGCKNNMIQVGDPLRTPVQCEGKKCNSYAHRICVQRWCNEKGDIVCEICHQQFEPGYIAPPPLFQCGGTPMNFRGNWEVSSRDIDPPFIDMVANLLLTASFCIQTWMTIHHPRQ